MIGYLVYCEDIIDRNIAIFFDEILAREYCIRYMKYYFKIKKIEIEKDTIKEL